LGLPHAGIISFRSESVDIAPQMTRLEAVLAEHGSDLSRTFIVTESEIRTRDG
jgi:hypothetical protein